MIQAFAFIGKLVFYGFQEILVRRRAVILANLSRNFGHNFDNKS